MSQYYTRRSCLNMLVEEQFADVIETTDEYDRLEGFNPEGDRFVFTLYDDNGIVTKTKRGSDQEEVAFRIGTVH